MASFPDQLGPGAFVPLTDIFDSQHIYELEVGSPEFKEFLVRLRQSMNDIAMVLNIKDTGYYVDQEFVNGQAFFPNPALTSTTSQTPVLRQVFRKVINFGTLPNTGTTTVAHGIEPFQYSGISRDGVPPPSVLDTTQERGTLDIPKPPHIVI